MILVLKAGLFTTVQDLGRFGYRNIGVPVSGVMDSISAGVANALLNNKNDHAVLEITTQGPQLQFLANTAIALSGAEMSPKINNKPIINNKRYVVQKNDILSFDVLKNGMRCYLAVQGGFDSKSILGSRSFYPEITATSTLSKGDKLAFKASTSKKENTFGQLNKKPFYNTSKLTVYKGPEFDLFSSKAQQKLLSKNYTVSNDSNRMGYQLKETSVKHQKNIITSPVLPGTVQLTPAGKLIVLMKDAQTTGGYPRVLQLSEKAIAILAQKKAGDLLNFSLSNL